MINRYGFNKHVIAMAFRLNFTETNHYLQNSFGFSALGNPDAVSTSKNIASRR